jgi:hypothetical protein
MPVLTAPLIPDLRSPTGPMWQRPVRLPQALADQVAQQAAAIGTSQAALTRAFIARGSAELAESLAQGLG